MSTARVCVFSGGFTVTEQLLGGLRDSQLKLKNPDEIPLLTETKARGLLAYLLGHTDKIARINDPELDALMKRIRVEVTRSWQIQSAYFRRRWNDDAPAPSVNLSQMDRAHADPIIELLWDVLVKLCGSSRLCEINEYFKKQVPWEETTTEIEAASIPEGPLKEAIAKFLENAFEEPQRVNARVIQLIQAIQNECADNPKFRKRLAACRYRKFSVFTSPGQTRQWVKEAFVPRVKGTPVVLLSADFDIWLPDLNSTEAQRLLAGPGLAQCGEGGIAVLEILENADLPSTQHSTISLTELRKRLLDYGVKMKKWPWESAA